MSKFNLRSSGAFRLRCSASSFPYAYLASALNVQDLDALAAREREAGYGEEIVSLAVAARTQRWDVWYNDSQYAVSPSGRVPRVVSGHVSWSDPVNVIRELGMQRALIGELGNRVDSLGVFTLNGVPGGDRAIFDDWGDDAVDHYISQIAAFAAPYPDHCVFADLDLGRGVSVDGKRFSLPAYRLSQELLPGVTWVMRLRAGLGNGVQLYRILIGIRPEWYQYNNALALSRLVDTSTVNATIQLVDATTKKRTSHTHRDPGLGGTAQQVGGWTCIPRLHRHGGPQFVEEFFGDCSKPPAFEGNDLVVSTTRLGVYVNGRTLLAMTERDTLTPEESASLVSKSVLFVRSMRSVTVAANPERRTAVYAKVDSKGGSKGIKELRKSRIVEDDEGPVTWAQANDRASGQKASFMTYFGDHFDETEPVRLTISSTGAVSAVGDGHTGEFITAEDALGYYIGGANVTNNFPSKSVFAFFNDVAGGELHASMRTDSDTDEFAEGWIHRRARLNRETIPANRLAATDMLQFAGNRSSMQETYNACMTFGSQVTHGVKIVDSASL